VVLRLVPGRLLGHAVGRPAARPSAPLEVSAGQAAWASTARAPAPAGLRLLLALGLDELGEAGAAGLGGRARLGVHLVGERADPALEGAERRAGASTLARVDPLLDVVEPADDRRGGVRGDRVAGAAARCGQDGQRDRRDGVAKPLPGAPDRLETRIRASAAARMGVCRRVPRPQSRRAVTGGLER
jgi:hypothetical protein